MKDFRPRLKGNKKKAFENLTKKENRILVIGDLHEPFGIDGYLKFCKETYQKHNCNKVIFIGDLNDFDGIVLDVNSNKPTSQVLSILKGAFGEYKGKYELTSVAENVKQSERYSDWYDSDNNCNTQSDKDYSMIDHVLVTSGIKNKILDEIRKNQEKIKKQVKL